MNKEHIGSSFDNFLNEEKIQINQELYKRAWEKYGEQLQLTVAMEECAELIKELSKLIRGKNNLFNVQEEVADVEIMLEQLKFHYNLDEVVTAIKLAKLKRLQERITSQ